MTIKGKSLLLASAASVLAATAAQAAPIDVSPLINEAITDIGVPVLIAIGPTVAAILVMPLRRLMSQTANEKLKNNVNDLLDKAISAGADAAAQWVDQKDFHVQVDGWIANVAADYAVSHAPTLMKQAGAATSAWAGKAAKDAAAGLLAEKISARMGGHPAVAAVKALAPAAA